MFTRFFNYFKVRDLRTRILITLALLAVYRIGVYITTPGTNRVVMGKILKEQSQGTFFGMFNLFSGGAFKQLSIFALGIMPYISASIILSLLVVVIKPLERLQKEGGEQGRQKINQYTRYGTVLLSIVQGFGISYYLESQKYVGETIEYVVSPNINKWMFRFITIVTLTGGTMFLMWLGEKITEFGVGNGISLIIFAGIVVGLPDAVIQTVYKARQGKEGGLEAFDVIILGIIMLITIAFVVFLETAYRKLKIQNSKQRVGGGGVISESSVLPLKVNMSGVIPPIFASSLLMFPTTIAGFSQNATVQKIVAFFQFGSWGYDVFYILLIIFFTYFYTAIQFNSKDMAENLQKSGGAIPGVRPGEETIAYLDKVVNRLTFAAGIYLSAVSILPGLLIKHYEIPFFFGGTSLLIVVGVALDTLNQMDSYVIGSQYANLSDTTSAPSRIRGRRYQEDV
ncbi:preprotein translocase subunit SecY [bacterium]|nr:preprotein translocase subunit SecY [bacterium]